MKNNSKAVCNYELIIKAYNKRQKNKAVDVAKQKKILELGGRKK